MNKLLIFIFMLLGTAIGSLADYLPIMPPGRSWILQVDDAYANPGESGLMGFLKMEVDRTVIIDGKEWVRLVSAPVEFRDGEWEEISSTGIDMTHFAVIYAYQDLQTGSLYWLGHADDAYMESIVDLPLEIPQLLFSFTESASDWWLPNHQWGNAEEFVTPTTVPVLGEERKAMYVIIDDTQGAWIVDGIGFNTESIWITVPTGLWVVPQRTLLECRQDGEVIFTKVDFDALEAPGANVQRPALDPVSSDAPLYDIMGQCVTEPIPGSIYIRGGKKFIVPKR